MNSAHFEGLLKQLPTTELKGMLDDRIHLCLSKDAVFRTSIDDLLQLQMEIEILALVVTERRIDRRNNNPWQQPEYPPICFKDDIKRIGRNIAKGLSKSELAAWKRSEFETLAHQILLAREALRKSKKTLTTKDKNTLNSLCLIGKAMKIETMPEPEPEPEPQIEPEPQPIGDAKPKTKPKKKKGKQKKEKKSVKSKKPKSPKKKEEKKQEVTEKALKVTEEAKKTAAEAAKTTKNKSIFVKKMQN